MLNRPHRALPVAHVQEALEEVLLSFPFLERSFREAIPAEVHEIWSTIQGRSVVLLNFELVQMFLWPRQTTVAM